MIRLTKRFQRTAHLHLISAFIFYPVRKSGVFFIHLINQYIVPKLKALYCKAVLNFILWDTLSEILLLGLSRKI